MRQKTKRLQHTSDSRVIPHPTTKDAVSCLTSEFDGIRSQLPMAVTERLVRQTLILVLNRKAFMALRRSLKEEIKRVSFSADHSSVVESRRPFDYNSGVHEPVFLTSCAYHIYLFCLLQPFGVCALFVSVLHLSGINTAAC